jgi:Glycosyl transferase family 11
MITCQSLGGLGNQLFQIATTLALAIEHQDEAIFDFDRHQALSQGNEPARYRTTIYRNLTNQKLPPCKSIFREQSFGYRPIPYHSDLMLVGFFQSDRYFSKYRQELLDIFAPPSQIVDELRSKYGFILERPNCAIHVRRGDYVGRTQYNPVCSLDYYRSAIELFERDTKFLVCSDDINWCKQIWSDERFIFSEYVDEVMDLYLMSMCQHHIIANSTFSWWAAWLDRNPHKKIVAPKKWFGSALGHLNTDDIYTRSMLKI